MRFSQTTEAHRVHPGCRGCVGFVFGFAGPGAWFSWPGVSCQMGPSCRSQGKMLFDHHPTFQVVAVYKYMSDYLQGLHDNSRIIPKILFGLPQPLGCLGIPWLPGSLCWRLWTLLHGAMVLEPRAASTGCDPCRGCLYSCTIGTGCWMGCMGVKNATYGEALRRSSK